MTERFSGGAGDERQESERHAVARGEFVFVFGAGFGDLRHIDAVHGGDVGGNALAHHHVLGDLDAHVAHGFHAGLRGGSR